MKLLKHLALLPFIFFFIGIVHAGDNQGYDIFHIAPFRHVEVRAASKIYVDYKFDSHTQILVCTADKSNEEAVTSVEWSVKGVTRKLELPITLNDDTRFEGYAADSSGRLTITNEFGSLPNHGSIFVSCEYRNML